MKMYLLLTMAAVALAGCTLFDRQERRINYTENVTSPWGPPTIITDAKQRAIINAPANVGIGDAVIGPNGEVVSQFVGDGVGDAVVKNHPQRIICAEPSPDVAQAISAAFSAAAQVDAKLAAAPAAGATVGGSQQIAGSGSVGSAYASSIAQLGERLSTVALLRDKMYRACEAYQNGAISDTSYTLMLARFDKTMTSLLSSELAAGAFGRNLAALGGSASTRGVDPKQLADAKEAAKSAAKDLSAAAALPETNDTEKAKKAEALKQAGTKLDDAVAKLADLELQAAATAAQSGPGTTGVLGQITSRSALDADAVARINANFLDDDASGSLIDACLVALDRRRDVGTRHQPNETTLRALDAEAGALADQLNTSRAEVAATEEKSKATQQTLAATPKSTAAQTQNTQAMGELAAAKERMNGIALQLADVNLRAARERLGPNPQLSQMCATLMLQGPEGLIFNLQKRKLELRKSESELANNQISADKAQAEAEKAASEAAAAKTEKEKLIIASCNTKSTDVASFNKCVADLTKVIP